MKKILLMLSITFSLTATYARILSPTVYDAVRNYMDSRNYTVAEDRYKDMKEGESTYLYRTFVKGYTYIIYGFTDDEDVQDLDLYLYDSDGTRIKEDIETDARPVIFFTPSYTRELKIVLKNAESDTPYYASNCRFMVGFK